MVKDGSSATNPFVTQENGHHHSFSFHQRGEEEKGYMETEGRGFSGLYRNTSEEMFLKSLMESPVGMPVPTMEMLGFKNLTQPFRADSEELFKSWLTNGETNGYSSTGIAHRTRQASRRISTELGNFPTQQQGSTLQEKRGTDVSSVQNATTTAADSGDPNHLLMRNAVERNMQASNLYLAKAWFHSPQPMTRSRSSELRRRYVAMQNSQTNLSMEAIQDVPEHGVINFEKELANPNSFNELPLNDAANQFGSFTSPANSSSSTFNNPQMGNVDKVSSVVNMLKGTLERKKLGNHAEKETIEDGTTEIYSAQESIVNFRFDDINENGFDEIPRAFHQVSPGGVKDHGALQTMQDPIDPDLEGFVNSMNPLQFNTVSQEPSQSESSTAAPVVSSGFDVYDGPSNSSQNYNIAESSSKPAGNRDSESGSRAKEFRERIIDNLKDERKRGGLVRYGSINSSGSVEKGDPTKKRRVERSRKMAEAKERSLTPAIPPDMQSILKRCENLEKEVRSLKLNLSFMNRKDSEQTKQIEDLQKTNEELTDEKKRLLEEIERIISETGKM